MNNCYLGHKEAIKNLESDILKSGYKPVPLKNRYNLEAFTKHNESVSVEAAKIRKVVDLWDSSLARLGIKGSVVKSIVKDNLADGDSSVPFARRVIDIEYNEDVLEKLDDFRKSLGIYDSKLSYASYLDAKRAEQESLKANPIKTDLSNKYFSGNLQSKSVDVLESLSKSSHPLNKLAKKLIEYAKLNNVNIKLVDKIADQGKIKNPSGVYLPSTNDILINTITNYRGSPETVILHEIIHSLTYKTVKGNSSAVKDLNKLINHARNYLPPYNPDNNTGTYALYNADEFLVALFTDGEFINQLLKIPATGGKKYLNLFEEVFDYILGLFKINKDDSLYTNAFAVATNISDEFKQSTEAANDYNQFLNESGLASVQNSITPNYDISRNTGILSGDIKGESVGISTSLSTSLGGEPTTGLEEGYLFPTGSNGGDSDSFKSKISGKTYKEIWTSKQFTDNEKRDALLMFLNQELLSPDSFNGKLFSKITSELGQVGTFLVNDRLFYAKQDSINLNLQAFYNGLKQENPIDIEGSIKHILYEELIHVLTYKITTTEELDAIVKEQGFLMLENAVEDAYTKIIPITDRTTKGRVLAIEYLRMLVQQDTQQTGSELMLQGAKTNLITKLKEAWQFLRDIVKPKTKEVVDRHIAFINKKLDNTTINQSLGSVKEGVEELFNENLERANQVYSALGFNKSTFDTKGITLSEETSIGWMFIQFNNKKIGRVKFVNNGEKGQLGLSIEINEKYQNKGYGQVVHTLMADLAKKDYKSGLYSDYQNSSQEIQLLNSLVKKGYAEKIGDVGKASKEYPDSFVTEERAFRIKTSDEIQQITPQQKHVLGGKNDIQGFKKFVNQSSKLNSFENERLNAAKEINKELLQSSKGRSADRLQSAKISPMETELNKKFFSTDTFYKKRALSETEKTTEDEVFEVGSNNSLLYAIRQKLSDPNSVNGRLFAKLNSLAKIKVIITDSKDDIYVVGNDLYINPEGFSKSLAESDGENYLEALLFEELIHIASNRIVPKSKEQSIINAQIKADPDFVSKVNQSYVTDNKRQAYFEYIRIKVQDAVTSTTTLKERMTWSDQLLGVYKELLDIIYSVIETKTTKKLIKEHIEFVEDAIKEQRASSIKPASSELKDYFKRVQQTPEVGNLLSVIDDVLPQYPAYDINSLVGLLIEAPEFTQDLKNTPGTGFPYVNLHKEVSTALLKAKGIIPNTEAYYKAMEMFGYENKPLTFAEDKTGPISSSEINSLKNDIISTSNRVLSDKKLIEPSSDSSSQSNNRGETKDRGYTPYSDALLKKFNGKTFTEIFNSDEFTEDEKKSALLRSLQERLVTGDTFNTRLYRKLRLKSPKLSLRVVENERSGFYVFEDTLNVNLNKYYNVIKNSEIKKLEDYLELAVSEELIHLVTNQIDDKNAKRGFSYQLSKNPLFINAVSFIYGSISEIDSYYYESVRMMVQKKYGGKITESEFKKNYNDFLDKIAEFWEYIKDLFSTDENKKIIQDHIDFIGEQPDIIPNLENNGQLPEYSKMVELLQELTTGEIPNNTPVLRPDFRLYFNPPLLSKRAKIPVQDTERYVAIFDSIQERLGERTLTELRDSREFDRMEWGGILLYALEQALRLEMPINSETIQKVKDFLVGNNRLNDSTFAESDSQFFSREDFQNRLSDEFVSADAPIFQLNLPKPPDRRYKSDAANNVLYTGKKVTVLNALQERAGNRNINELWVSGEFNDLEWEQLLILYLRKKLLDTNTFHGRLYKKLKSELGDDFRVDVSNSNKFTFFVEGTEIKINTKEVIKELKKNKITNINRSLELTLAEEMIHVVSNVLRTPQEYKNLFVSQFLPNEELRNNLSEVYRSFKERMGTYQAPVEFYRMAVQDHFFKQVTEMSAYSLQDFYQSLLKGLKYLRDVFVEPTNKKLIDEHIAYIEEALRNIDVVSYETLMQYNTTPEIWEVAESVEQFDRFKKDYPFPENTEELIKDFKEFANLVPANINLDCK
jgi:hypothetical protein